MPITLPPWLADAHTILDHTVAFAYGWPADLSDDDALRELLALNLTGKNDALENVRTDRNSG